ncbi:MAG: biotin/lipoate A/B protein ligase family protein [Cyanobacteria bacterium J06554_6]
MNRTSRYRRNTRPRDLFPVQHPRQWRLIPPMVANGHVHMAVDRWLLRQHCRGLHPPTLRFYTWSPVAISLGYHQRQYPPRWDRLSWQGQFVERVRRPTGGRAVLHQGDLTYAIVSSGLTGSRRQVYEQLCQFLIEGWYSLGVPLTFGGARQGDRANPSCFSAATTADLVTPRGVKLVGSAQRYEGGCVLQHGSMRLRPDTDLFQTVFREAAPLFELPLPLQTLSWEALQNRVVAALTTAAATTLDISLKMTPMSADEINLACSDLD